MRGCKRRQFGHVSNQEFLQIKRPSIVDQDEEAYREDAMIRWLVGVIGFCVVASHALAADLAEIGIGYLRHAGVKANTVAGRAARG